jgi:tripartite ATP-independent transporter DctP family solute receptor
MKKYFVLLLVVLFIMSVSASVVQAKTLIRLASSFEPGHIIVQNMEKFKELVEASGQGIEVQLFPGGSMGSEEELYNQVAIGAIEMQAGGIISVQMYAPEYYFMDVPYVMKDFNHFMNIWNGKLGLTTRELIRTKGGQETLAIIYKGMRQMTSKKPIYNTADLTNLKLRLPQIPSWVAVWKGLGAKPVPIALPELFTSLQTGIADASEGEPSQILSFKLYEVQNHLILTYHKMEVGDLTINLKFLESLTPAQQKAIRDAAIQSSDWATKKNMAEEEGLIKILEEKGMKIITPDAEDFRVKARPIIEELFKDNWPVTTWAEVLTYAK